MATIQCIRIAAPGGPDVMRLDSHPVPNPGPGEARVRHSAIGVNFIDIYHRSGAYPLPAMPHGIGMEGAGVVEAVGAGVRGLREGDRVAYASGPPGAYAEARALAADRLVPLPAGIDDRTAAAVMLQGMTARYLLRQTCRVRPGDTILVLAAAGGMGQFLAQWGRHLGATVIGTVSTDAKAVIARGAGCHEVIVTGREDMVSRVMALTGGRGVRVVYDGVGKDTLLQSLACLDFRGVLANYGSASGAPEPISPAALGAKSAFLTRPTLFHHVMSRADLLRSARDVFAVLAAGAVRISPPATYALAEAARAHADLEGRRTTGKLLLIP